MAESAKPKKSLKDQAHELIQGLVDAVGSLVSQPVFAPIPVVARPRPQPRRRGRR